MGENAESSNSTSAGFLDGLKSKRQIPELVEFLNESKPVKIPKVEIPIGQNPDSRNPER
ncbi:hypothetical protein M513_11210 [Trichuris suis]|uniref:Uncharacterized protein n=1 Tax=Trichuris suis TaxID=68888 RepID=A0A085LSH3_9BILA|nr:hypothetical protein M513_11210 [Trichuris suis]